MVRLHKKTSAEIAEETAEVESAKKVKKSKTIADKPAHESDENDEKSMFINTKENIWS